MKRPASDALLTAAEWLDVNEGEAGEMEECRAVAEWLRAQAQGADIRALAKQAGVSTAVARRAVKAAHK